MLQCKSYEKRAASANFNSDRNRPFISTKLQIKKYGRTYTQSHESYKKIKKNKGKSAISSVDNIIRENFKKSKAPEDLIQENMHLKVELNLAKNRLNLTRSKIQYQKKKHFAYTKKFNRQFEKELYWPNEKNNQYLITGVKYQYQKLKQSYELKCSQLEVINQTLSSTNLAEIKSYCDILEAQNKSLVQNLINLKKQERRSSQFLDLNSSPTHFTYADLIYMLQQERKKQNQYRTKIKQLFQQMTKQLSIQKQLSKKIKFLEKLMIQKENATYHANKKVKILEKQKLKLTNQSNALQSSIIQKEQEMKKKFTEFKQKADRQAQIEKNMLQKHMKEKNLTIQKLQKEIAYLSTLISYWKPLDQADKNEKLDQQSLSNRQQTINFNNQNANTHSGQTRSKTPANVFLPDNKNNEDKFSLKNSNLQDLSFVLQTINKDDEEKDQSVLNREPRKSNEKWNEGAKKCRKVQLSEVQHLGQLIRFKMIAAKKSVSDVKQFFTSKIVKQNANKSDDLITMKQVKQILKTPPFQLSEEDACLLSRYIIQDQRSQYVYCHEGNELERSIAKSIMKAVVGDYTIPDFEKSEQKWNQIKKIYSHNMQLALKSICPKGQVSKDKLFELINSLGIQADDQTKNYIIGRLIQNSSSLKSLKYGLLFTAEEKIQ